MQFSRGGGLCTAEAEAQIDFEITKVVLNKGEAVIEGYFYNEGDRGGKIVALIIRNLQVTTTGGKFLWACTDKTIDMENEFLAPGKTSGLRFRIRDPKIPQYGTARFGGYWTIRQKSLQ